MKVVAIALLCCPFAMAADPYAAVCEWQPPAGVQRFDIGVTTDGGAIPAFLTADDLDLGTKKLRILLVGESEAEGRAAMAAIKWFHEHEAAKPYRERFAISAVPVVHPSGPAIYPPAGDAYAGNVREAHALWRWIGLHAPDLVVELSNRTQPATTVPATADERLRPLGDAVGPDGARDLISALVQFAPASTGTVPALRARYDEQGLFLPKLFDRIDRAKFRGPSPARLELQRRLARTPIEVAKVLAKHYGHGLDGVSYIPALALVGRVRLGDLTGDPTHEADVRRIIEPYRAGRATFGERPNGSNVAGHLVFSELAKRKPDPALRKIVQDVIDAACDVEREGTPFLPHSEMSDAVFMGGPLLAQAATLEDDPRRLDVCLRHVRFMTELNLRKDGLHRHSPLDETAWGRGNGFPALGLAMILKELPETDPRRAKFLTILRDHMTALGPHQDATGMWHQVVDLPGSYREMSSTCMITYAMLRGLRRGWLDRETYEPIVDRSWPAISQRIGSDGGLVDVCTGTGKQKSLQDYLDRKAILGRDPRGGAMALLVSTERAAWERERDQDRFGRFDGIDAGEWVAPLRCAGVRLVTVNEGPID